MIQVFHLMDQWLRHPLLLLVFIAFLLDACVLYPPYTRPCVEMPDNWRVSVDETSTVVNSRWWEQFQDPIMNDLIQEALASNQDLRLATARIAAFQAQLRIVNSQFYPQIYLQGDVSRQRISQTTADQLATSLIGNGAEELTNSFPIISPYSNDYLAILTASYELDFWGKIRSASEAAFADLLGQVNARRTLILTVVSSTAAAYMQLRKYDLQLKISTQTVDSRENSLNLAKIRFKEGLTSELEVKQAAADRDEAAIQRIQFKTFIAQQENLLSVLIGHPPKSIQRGREVSEWVMPPEIPGGLPMDLLEQRPDILEAENELMAANFRIGEAKALFFADLTLTGYYGYESSLWYELFTDPSRTWQWLLNLLQPLFTGGRLISNLDLAKAEKQEALYSYLQIILNALKEVNDALVAHQNSKEALVVHFTRVADLKEYLHLAVVQYRNGLVDYLNVLDAERNLFDAQLSLAQAQTDIFLTLVSLYKALGGGWVIDAENLMKEQCSS